MSKLFRYELRLIACNRFYGVIAAISILLGWLILSTRTIRGVAHTAPFSPWSFGSYLADMLPFLGLALFFLTKSSAQGLAAERVIAASSVRPAAHLAIRIAAAGTAWLGLAGVTVLTGILFLRVLFRAAVSIPALLIPAAYTLIPAMLFLLGLASLATLLGRRLFWAAPLLLLALHGLPHPVWADLAGATFYASYPLSFAAPDPVFAAPLSFYAGRLAYSLAGLFMLKLVFVRKAALERRVHYSWHTPRIPGE